MLLVQKAEENHFQSEKFLSRTNLKKNFEVFFCHLIKHQKLRIKKQKIKPFSECPSRTHCYSLQSLFSKKKEEKKIVINVLNLIVTFRMVYKKMQIILHQILCLVLVYYPFMQSYFHSRFVESGKWIHCEVNHM